MENPLQKYKNIWYAYFPIQNIWYISEKEDRSGNVVICNSDKYRIDQAIDKYYEEVIDKMFWKDTPAITYEELRAKILPGYMYSIDSEEDPFNNVRATRIRTGQGGILLYLDEC